MGVVYDNALGKRMGEPTGNAPASYENINRYTTPYLSLVFTVSKNQWIRPDTRLDPANALLPDILVPLTITDVRAGRGAGVVSGSTLKHKKEVFMTTSITRTQLATLSSRIFALIIDGLVLGLFTGALYALLGNPRTEGVLTFFFTLLFQWYFLTRYNGQTPGKMLLGIRVVKTDGTPITTNDALIRTLGYSLNWILLGLGWLLAFMNDNRQGLHDKLAHTYVAKVER